MHKTEHSHPQNTAILRIHTWCSSPTITEMKAPLEILFGMAERPAVAFFNLFYGCKMMTSEHNIESLEEPQVVENKIWWIWWLEFSSSRTTVDQLGGCDKAHYHGAAPHSFFLLFWSSKPLYIRYQFHLLYLQSSHTELMSQLYKLWPHLLFTTFYPSPPQSCTNGRSRIYATTE